MSAERTFADTNVLVYLFDNDADAQYGIYACLIRLSSDNTS